MTSTENRRGDRFPRSSRLTRQKEFQAVLREGRRTVGTEATVITRSNDQGEWRLGIIARKSLGDAVERNRAKRWVREWFRHAPPRPFDLVVIPKPELLKLESGRDAAAVLDSILARARLA